MNSHTAMFAISEAVGPTDMLVPQADTSPSSSLIRVSNHALRCAALVGEK